EGDGQPVLLRRQRAGGPGGVGAGGVLQAVEVEQQLAGSGEAVVRDLGVEEAAGAVGGGLRGRIAEDEEEGLAGGVFKDRCQAKRLSSKRKLGRSGCGQVEGGPDDGGDAEGLRRV